MSDLQVGDSFDGFTLKRRIATGGQGTGWLATTKTRLEVFLKIDLEPADSRDRQTVSDRHAFTVRMGLNIPYVVEPISHGVVRGRPYIVTRYIDGMDLGQAKARCGGPLPPQLLLQVVLCVGYGLTAMHARGVVHADIKPPNILLDQSGRAYIVDLQLACPVGSPAPGGTPHFSAPEQFQQGHPVDARADVYAYAATICHSCFDLRAPEVSQAVASTVPLRELAPALEQALSPDPQHRPGSVRQLMHRLLADGASLWADSGSRRDRCWCGAAVRPGQKYCTTCATPKTREVSQRCGACGGIVNGVCSGCSRRFGERDAALMFTHGPMAGHFYHLPRGTLTMGRDQFNSLDPYVSRQHMNLTVDETGVLLADAGAKNPAMVNGSPIRTPVTCSLPARVAIGRSTAVLIP